MDYDYLGWVPCISGHLDFGLMKPGISGGFTNKKIKNDKTNRINFGYSGQKNHHARRIILQSSVNWRDRLSATEYDGAFRVFVVAEAPENTCMDDRELRGCLYLHSVKEREEERAECQGKAWLKEIHKAQDIYDRSNGGSSEWSNTRHELNQCFENIQLALNSADFWRVDFKVTCGGLVFLTRPAESSAELSDEEEYLIARQAYYYIKYSLHSHKHHQAEQDSLTTIVPYGATVEGRRDAALKVLCQLKRELTHIKRVLTHEQRLYSDDALGILSYMGSLLTTLNSGEFIDDDAARREAGYIDSLRSSFQTQESRSKNFRTIEESTRSTYRVYIGWTLAVASLFFGIVARPYYQQVPESEKLEIPLAFPDLAILFSLALLVSGLLYQKLSAHFIKSKLDETSIREFVADRYEKGRWQLIRSFALDNKGVIFAFLLLVGGALAAFWAGFDVSLVPHN